MRLLFILDTYSVLAAGFHHAKPEGFLRFSFIAAVYRHYLPPPPRLNTTAFKSRPKTLHLQKRVYNLKNDCSLMCFVFLSQQFFSILRVSLGFIQKPVTQWMVSLMSHPTWGQSLKMCYLCSGSLCTWHRWGVNSGFCQFKAKFWRQRVSLNV